nr:putative immunity function [Saccharomycopsis selenospora]
MIFEEQYFSLNKEQVLKFHVHAYYGELELFKNYVSSEIISNFLETSCYCISEGCKKNFDFAKFCKNNISFLNKNYYNSIAIGYILAGEWEDDIILDINIINNLYKISDISLSKICLVDKLKDIAAYLCILKQKENLFNTINSPEMMPLVYTLTKNMKLKNYFTNSYEFDPVLSNWFPLSITTVNEDMFDVRVFENKLYYDNLIKVYGLKFEIMSITDLSNIKGFEKYIYYNDSLITDKIVNRNNIIEDIRVCRKAKINHEFDNLVKCRLLLLFQTRDFVYDNMFFEYINKCYSPELIPYVSEHQKWGIIYSIIKSHIFLKLNLNNFDYIEYNCLLAAYETCSLRNIRVFNRKLKEGYKCYKMIDFDNCKYIDKEEINVQNLHLEYSFNVYAYI